MIIGAAWDRQKASKRLSFSRASACLQAVLDWDPDAKLGVGWALMLPVWDL